MSKKAKLGVASLSVAVGIGLVMIMIACFGGGISWIPQVFSFLSQFGF